MNPQDVLELIQAAQRWNKANRDLLEAYERRTKPPAKLAALRDGVRKAGAK